MTDLTLVGFVAHCVSLFVNTDILVAVGAVPLPHSYILATFILYASEKVASHMSNPSRPPPPPPPPPPVLQETKPGCVDLGTRLILARPWPSWLKISIFMDEDTSIHDPNTQEVNPQALRLVDCL